MSIKLVEKEIKNNILAGRGFVTKFVDIGQGSGKLNNGVLQAEKSDKFIQALSEATTFMDKTKMISSNNHKRELDTMGFDIELDAGRLSGTPQVLSEYQLPTYGNRAFSAEELRALTGIHRTAMKENIEGPGFMNTLTQKFGAANGRALERVLIYGNTASEDDTVRTGYKVIDGICKKLTDDADLNNEEIDLTENNPIEEVRALLDEFPDVYKEDGDLALFCPAILKRKVSRFYSDNKDKYDVSEVSVTMDGNKKVICVEDVPLIPVPAFSVPRNGFTQKPAILTHKENIQWLADNENIIVESDFNLRANVWDIASTMYADINFALPDASALAWLKEA